MTTGGGARGGAGGRELKVPLRESRPPRCMINKWQGGASLVHLLWHFSLRADRSLFETAGAEKVWLCSCFDTYLQFLHLSPNNIPFPQTMHVWDIQYFVENLQAEERDEDFQLGAHLHDLFTFRASVLDTETGL